MYQAIYYDFKEYKYYLRDDVKGWLDFKYQPTYYRRVPEQCDDAVPVLTGGWAVPTNKFDKEDPNLLEKDISKELVLLRDIYYKYDDSSFIMYFL